MIEVAAPTGDRCGEGAVWSAPERAVYWTDINRFLVHRFDEASSSTRSWLFDEPVVALSLTTDPGRMLVCLASKLIWWWPATDRRQDHGFHLDGFPRVRLNDGRTDPLGNFWVGSMKNNVLPDGELGEAGPAKASFSASPPMAASPSGWKASASPTPSVGPPTARPFTSATLSTTSSGPSTTTQARSPTAATTSAALTGAFPTARPSTPRARSGTAASAAAASPASARTAHSSASTSASPTSPPASSAARTCGRFTFTSASIVTPPGHRLAGSLFRTVSRCPAWPKT